MKWSREEIERNHWKAVTLEINVFITYVDCYRRTAPGVRYYVDCTSEQDAELHKDLARDILIALKYLKRMEIGAYKTIVHMYKDDIRDAIKVYRESKAEA